MKVSHRLSSCTAAQMSGERKKSMVVRAHEDMLIAPIVKVGT